MNVLRRAGQAIPDHHQASAGKMKLKTTMGTWNVRTMLQKEKLGNIKQEMKRMEINILGISAGKITPETFEIIFLGGTEHRRGVAILLDQKMVKQSMDIGHYQIEFYF